MADPRTQFRPLPRGTGAVTDDTTLRVLHTEPQLSRTNYFDGRLLTASAFNRDVAYFDRRLLDTGLAAGDGIAKGLETSLVNQTVLRITGGVGIARSGRAIVLERPAGSPLEVDLGDTGLIAARNAGIFTGFHDGYYAVALMHSVAGSGATDLFPRDLTAARTTAYDTVTDYAEIVLVPIPAGRLAATGFKARAVLARLFAGQPQTWLPDDCVPLGILATSRGLPAWFDPSLLRHPVRTADAPDAVQRDLAASYRTLYADIVTSLGPAGAAGAPTFAAADYFSLLPPAGLLPKAAIDPQAGTQSFFPETIDVVLAPVRTDELDTLLDEAMAEAPIDLANNDPAQLVILAPLSPTDFGMLARALLPAPDQPAVQPFKPYPSVLLPRIDPLALRVRGRPGLTPAATATTVWAKIWDAVTDTALPYLVRPVDGAARGTSVAVLATGYALPANAAPPDNAAIAKLKSDLKDAQDKADAATQALAAANTDNSTTVTALQAQLTARQQASDAATARATAAEAAQQTSDTRAAALAAALQKVGDRLTKLGVASGPKITDPASVDATLADWDTTASTASAKNTQTITALQEQLRLSEARNTATGGVLTRVASRLATTGVAAPERITDPATADAALADWDTAETKQAADQTAAQKAASDLAIKLDAATRNTATLQAQNTTLTTQNATLSTQNATLTSQVATAKQTLNQNRTVLVSQRADISGLQRAGLLDPS